MKKFFMCLVSILVICSMTACGSTTSSKTSKIPEQLIAGKATQTELRQWCNDNGFEIVEYNGTYPTQTEGNEYVVEAFGGSIKNIHFSFMMKKLDEESGTNDTFFDDTLHNISIKYAFDDEDAYNKGLNAITDEVNLLNEIYSDIMTATVEVDDASGSVVGKYHNVVILKMESKAYADITQKMKDFYENR